MRTPEPADRTSLGDLVTRLAEQASELARHEMRLAQLEVQSKARIATCGVAMIASGALVAYAGVIALVFALIWALDIRLPLWGAALITGVLVVAAGAALAWVGWERLRADGLIPEKTIQTMKENARWAKRQAA
jgi:uncharacterized membrane protein YqjE